MPARVALISINAGRADTKSHWPHYGWVLLATVLRDKGYEVQVFDQSFLKESDVLFVERIRHYRPDLLGISLYTTHVTRGLRLTRLLLKEIPGCRAIAGGPHVSLYGDVMAHDDLFAALVRFEAETVVGETVARVLRGETPGLVESTPTEGKSIPAADFSLAQGNERMKWLPIQLSRGCPFNCCFCEVNKIASRQIRYRDIETCLDEIALNLGTLMDVHTVRIVDDCPTLDRDRFKDFLHRYINRDLRARVSIDNMRADSIDSELLDLLKSCATPYVCVAAESGNPEVFKLIDKGENPEDIVRAGQMIRQKRVPLFLCFVIGLPGSTFASEMDSLRLAKSLKPDLIYWNMFLPHRGTRAREWFQEHGQILDEADRFSVPSYDLTFSMPACSTPEFPREERVRAYLKCVLETVSFLFTPVVLVRAFVLAARYRLWSSIPIMLVGLPRKFMVYSRLMLARLYARRRSGRRCAPDAAQACDWVS